MTCREAPELPPTSRRNAPSPSRSVSSLACHACRFATLCADGMQRAAKVAVGMGTTRLVRPASRCSKACMVWACCWSPTRSSAVTNAARMACLVAFRSGSAWSWLADALPPRFSMPSRRHLFHSCASNPPEVAVTDASMVNRPVVASMSMT